MVQIHSPRSIFSGSGLESWVAQRIGYMGNTFGPKGYDYGDDDNDDDHDHGNRRAAAVLGAV
jgi:hypothetical protein